MQAIVTARLKMASIIAEQGISRALRSKLPPVARYHISPGDSVLEYREEKNLGSAHTP